MACPLDGLLRSLPGVRPDLRDRATPGDRGEAMTRLGLRLTPHGRLLCEPVAAATGPAEPGARRARRPPPHGRLLCEPVADAAGLDEVVATRLGEAFAHGSGDGLLRLGGGGGGAGAAPGGGRLRVPRMGVRRVAAVGRVAPRGAAAGVRLVAGLRVALCGGALRPRGQRREWA